MSWFKSLNKKTAVRMSKARRTQRRKLCFEALEQRKVMASGIVNIGLDLFAPPGTALTLQGDGSNNDVSINQTLNVGEYLIQGKNGTLLRLNGVGATLPSITVNGINGNILVNLGTGNDTFNFGARPDNQPSNIPQNLRIENNHGSKFNSISDVLINGDLTVTKLAPSTGYSDLAITKSTVIGFTLVDNVGAGGDSKTVIDTTWLQGSAGGTAFTLLNGAGADIINVRGNSQFGIGGFVSAAPVAPVVLINNGDGGSQTTFTGASAIVGLGTTTVYGQLQITNGTNLPGFVDLVTFDGTNILGRTDIVNGEGNSTTGVTNSTVGSHLVLDNANAPLIGGPLIVQNRAGFDDLSITGSTLPWGLLVNNNLGGLASNGGSSTQISQSFIGTGPFGPRTGTPGDAITLLGDGGRDIVNILGSTIGGRLNLGLSAGNNEFNLTSNSVITGLRLVTQGGNDRVLIDKSKILVDVFVRLGAGADEFYVRNVVIATDLPNPLLGSPLDIDGEAGVDRTNLGSLIPTGFESLVL